MLKTLLVFALLTIPLLAQEPPCAQIDKSVLDTDGLPFCPDVVRATTAFAVTKCAYNQARDWHAATQPEKSLMMGLVQDLKDAKPSDAMTKADKLKLQTCRSKKDGDSFLLMYTKPGVKDYSGPFLMYREGGKTSQVVIHSPHDGQDGTHASTKAAFADSNALAMISNGHPRRLSGEAKGPYKSDWAHTSADLGYTAFLAFKQKFPESVHLHIHGLAANRVMITDSTGWDSAKHLLRAAFFDATQKAIGSNDRFDVVNWRFNGWITGQAMTQNENGKGRMDNERWVGAEVAVAIHSHTQILTKMVRNLEEDYLKKPREIAAAQLEKEVVPADGDNVEVSDEELPVAEEVDLKIDLKAEEDDSKNDLLPDVIEMETPAIPASTAVDSVVYAPYPKGNRGTKKLACVAVNYSVQNKATNNYMTAQRCLQMATRIAKYYNENSNNRLKLVPAGYQMDFPGDGWKVFTDAEKVAKQKFAANYYAIPNLFRKGGNHASGGIANLTATTTWVAEHEVGHLLGMGHSGKYTYDKDGKPDLENYGDEQSPMGNNGYRYLTAPEYYALGWLGKTGAALYTEPGRTFDITNIKAKKIDGPLFGVVVKGENFKGQNLSPIKTKHSNAFISFPAACPGTAKTCVALHLFQGGGSQRVMLKEGELYDPHFTGLHVKVLEGNGDKIKVSVDFDAPPAIKK